MNSKYNSIICNLNTSMYKNISVSYNAYFLDQTDSLSCLHSLEKNGYILILTLNTHCFIKQFKYEEG